MHKDIVFRATLVIVAGVVLFGIFFNNKLKAAAEVTHGFIIGHFGWLYLVAAFFFLIFCVVLAASRYGSIKLGKDHEKPQYSYFAWFSMLFAAGMGIGLIFWGVAEPAQHFAHPPSQITEKSDAAAFAMRHCFFHWGLQPWAIYIIMALSIAYFSFRRGMRPLISSCFYPLLGERINGVAGYVIDSLAVLATIFGIATSLGLGALQITTGLHEVFGFPDIIPVTLMTIGVVTILFIFSSATGLDKGIQLLSRSNMMLAAVLLVFMFLVGPTFYILNVFSSTVGEYVNNLISMSLHLHPFEGYEWTKKWTLFYWAWWIAWSPFVGLFVARISRGRTLREFICGALLVPTLLTFLWFSVFGGAALHLKLVQNEQAAAIFQGDAAQALFALFEYYPLTPALSLVSIVLLLVFFVTSADSATFVLGMMTSHGSLQPPLKRKIIWGILESGIACALLLAGGLTALREMAITAALPFTVVMLLLCYNLLRGLSEEYNQPDKPPSQLSATVKEAAEE